MRDPGIIQIGIPSYGGNVPARVREALRTATGGRYPKAVSILTSSILTRTFNLLYAQALNERDNGTTHFCLLHDDVVPEPLWLDKMMALMKKYDAEVLAAVIPIKSEQGLTSTALDLPVGDQDPYWRVKRLTLKEIYELYPATFTHEKILLNTGLMLIDFRKPWVEKIWFEFEDRIVAHPKSPNYFMAVGLSEDWIFSRRARELGARLFATREISVTHLGAREYSNASAWGTLREDAEGE